MGSSSHEPRTQQKQGKQRDPEYREQSHPQACPQREPLTVYPPVEDSAALRWWIEVRDLNFGFKSFFLFKFLQDAPPLQSFFASAENSSFHKKV